jgi:MFS family permease
MWTIGLPLSLVIRNTPEEYGCLPDGGPPKHPSPNLQFQAADADLTLGEVIRKRSYIFLNIVEAIRMLAIAAVATHVMPYLNSMGMARTTAGLVAAAIPLCSIMGRFGFGWLADLLEKRYVLSAAYLIMGIGLLAFCDARAVWAILLFLVFFSSGSGGSIILRGAILREYFGRRSLGKILGVIMGSASLGGIIGPTAAGWTFDTIGSYQFIWLIFCGLIGLTVVLILKIK